MVPAVFDQTTVDISANDYTFRASGSVMKFDGYLAVYQVVKEEEEKEDEGDTDSRTSAADVAKASKVEAGNHPPRSAFYGASTAIHGSDASERAGREGHRASFDVRDNHFDDRGARVREQRSGPVYHRHCSAKK